MENKNMDTINGASCDALCQLLRPTDYVDGRGLSEAGKKVEALLHAADARAHDVPIESDTSWAAPKGS